MCWCGDTEHDGCGWIMQKEIGFRGAKAIWTLPRGLAVAKDTWPDCPFKDVGRTAEDKGRGQGS